MTKFSGKYVVFLLVWGAPLTFGSSRAQAVPPNDDCTDWIMALDGDTAFSTVGAATDGVEEFPTCHFSAYANIFHDVWYLYTATCSGELTLDLCNSDFDTKVAVYNGYTCPAPSPPMGCNDDACGVGSGLTVTVDQGSYYQIRVGGYIGQEGTGVLSLNCAGDVTAACCYPNGSCENLTQTQCDAISGSEWQQGQMCGQAGQACAVSDCLASGDCFVAHPTPGCNDPNCCLAVCFQDSFCCNFEWDNACVAQAEVICVQPTGACCNRNAFQCTEGALQADCQGPGMEWHEGISCNQVSPPCAPAVPAVSEWGIVVLLLIGLTGATILFGNQRRSEFSRCTLGHTT